MIKSVAILGAGESGIGAARLAIHHGVDVFVSDFGAIDDETKKLFTEHNIPFEEKGHRIDNLSAHDVIVKSPGIPETAPVIEMLRLRQKTVISEIEFGSRFYSGRIIGVTGSNGKTTTASLMYHVLKVSGLSVGLSGNIGQSFSAYLAENDHPDWMVLELSSFQLDDIDRFHPHIAVILNITPDHLDRYADFESYGRAKWAITKNMDRDDHLVVNEDDPLLVQFYDESQCPAHVHWLSVNYPEKWLSSKDESVTFDMNLKGRHNAFNAAIVVKVSRVIGLSDAQISNALRSFQAIPHRLETVAHINGVAFVNDSKATNVDAVFYALESIPGQVVWIAGGIDKGNDYSGVQKHFGDKIKALICLGLDNFLLVNAFGNTVDVLVETQTMADAVREAFTAAKRGDTVLLSPACASFDLFRNYAHRGDEFKKEVFNLLDNK